MARLELIAWIIVGILGATAVARGDELCVRAGAAGAGDGSDWENAYPQMPDQLVRGNTYYLATGAYGAVTLDAPEAGDQLIQVVRATAADHGPDPGWQAAYAQGPAELGNLRFETGHVRIDGVTGGGPGSWETGFGLQVQGGWHTVQLEGGASHIQLAHLDVANNGRDTHDDNEHILYAIQGSTDVTFSYCYLHDVSVTHLLTRGSDGFVIEYCKLARNGPSGDGTHREAWSASDDDNVVIRHSVFEDISNTAVLGLVNGNGDAENWQIYGNVFLNTGNFDDVGISGFIVVKNADPTFLRAVGWRIHNNSFVNLQGLSAGVRFGDGSDNLVTNNIWYSNTVNIIDFWNTDHDHNWYAANIRTDGCDPPCDLDPDLVAAEPDAEAGEGDPFVDWLQGDFHLRAATRAGQELPPPLDRDMEGHLRGADDTWDRGALEFSESADDLSPAAPRNLEAS